MNYLGRQFGNSRAAVAQLGSSLEYPLMTSSGSLGCGDFRVAPKI
jgi:hypothetical protein